MDSSRALNVHYLHIFTRIYLSLFQMRNLELHYQNLMSRLTKMSHLLLVSDEIIPAVLNLKNEC